MIYSPNACLQKDISILTHIPGLCKHKWRPILLSLVVDDFGTYIRELYPVDEDCTGILYFGITLKWYYQKLSVYSYMTVYVEKSLHK